jgi:hypothetical protein
MTSFDLIAGILPTTVQDLLLRSIFQEDPTILDQWIKNVDLSSLDLASLRLLPLLQPKLGRSVVSEPLQTKVKEIYAQTRMRNRVLFSDLEELLHAFDQAGIQTLLLKGSALVQKYYRDPGLRPMVDLDVLVPTAQAFDAIHLLESLGYQPEKEKNVNFSEKLVPFLHGYAFESKSRAKVDLHWHVLTECIGENDDEDFWESSIPMEIGNATTRILNPADQIIHLCVHGCRWSNPSSIRWIADVQMVLNSNDPINWERLVEQTNQRRLSVYVLPALAYLRDRFGARFPKEILNHFSAPSSFEISELRYKTSDHSKRLIGNLPLLWFSYKRTHATTWGFFKYLQNFWGVEHFWQLPFAFLTRFLRRLEERRL